MPRFASLLFWPALLSPSPLILPHRALFRSSLFHLSVRENSLSPSSLSYSIVFSLPHLLVFTLPLSLSLSPPRRLLAFFFVSLVHTRERVYGMSLSLSLSLLVCPDTEEAANYRRYTRLTRAH